MTLRDEIEELRERVEELERKLEDRDAVEPDEPEPDEDLAEVLQDAIADAVKAAESRLATKLNANSEALAKVLHAVATKTDSHADLVRDVRAALDQRKRIAAYMRHNAIGNTVNNGGPVSDTVVRLGTETAQAVQAELNRIADYVERMTW